MSTRPETIVGASLAGATAAQTLRERGFDGRVVLMPEQTLRAFADHGDPTRALDIDLSEAEREGVGSFLASYDELLDRIASKHPHDLVAQSAER